LILSLISGISGIKQNSNITFPSPVSSNQPIIQNIQIINFSDKSYSLYWQKIESSKIKLIPNFSEKLTSQKIIQNNHCNYGANAGFYTTNNSPLGLFFANGKYINSEIHKSNFINGYLYKLTNQQIDIGNTLPNQELEFAFQSGPLFTPQTKLKIIDDKPARRILIGKNANDLYLLAITTANNPLDGPLLADVPLILTNSNIKFNQIINLDGGAASAYHAEEVNLSELAPIGSFLCGVK